MECERILYIIFDKQTFRNYGLPRTIRFTRTFDKLEDALTYYRKLENYERYIFTVVTLSEFLELKERYK